MEDEEVDKSGPSSHISDYPSEESTSFSEDDFVTLEDSYKSILDELIEDAMWDVCFEVHYAAKHGILLLDDPEKRKHPIVDDSEKDIFGQTLKSKVQNFQITCPICKNRSCATKYASHLAKCIGISGRNSSRAATKRIAATNAFSDDEDDWNSDSSFNGNKKKRKKSQGKKNNRKRSGKGQGNSISKSSSETNADYQEMTYEERKAFFNQMCGVISKRSNKMCMNTHKCSQHSDEQRRDVRHFLLRDMGDQITNDGQIDVDTVDEEMGGLSFLMQSLPTASEKYMSSMSGFNEKKNSAASKNSAAGFKKKKEGFGPVTSVSSPGQIVASGSSVDSV